MASKRDRIKKSARKQAHAHRDVMVSDHSTLSPEVQASVFDSSVDYMGSWTLRYDGQKNLGELGPAINYIPEYYMLSTRSWQAYIENDVAKSIIDKYVTWMISTGLKLKSNPAATVLQSEGIMMGKEQREAFNDVVESRWDIWANSKNSSFSGEDTFNEVAQRAYLQSRIGGDVLTVLRFVNKTVKVQLVDGVRIQTPIGQLYNPDSGNIISNGVEISPTGRHVRYWVRKKNSMTFEPISAYDDASGLRIAWLVYATKWRLDFHRGLPVVATTLESMKKLERYKEATVGSAEEIAKIAYQIVHQNYSSGESPLSGQLAKAFDAAASEQLPVDALGQQLANTVAATTNKSVFNNPKGAEMKPLNNGNSVSGFKEFYGTNADGICSAIGIPPNVAMSIYNNSYSSSRAATKDWDHSIDVGRDNFSNQFYKYIHAFWFYTEVLKGKINAPGYLRARDEGDFMVYESYERSRFTGPHFPHIDPLKEVNAERKKLGKQADSIPLGTIEASTEALGGGDSDSNMEQFADELAMARKLKIVPEEVVIPDPSSGGQDS